MKEEKHLETLNEVVDEIESALKDNRGLVFHQRRLAFSISLGAVNILEIYFHNLNIIKEGSQINHLWFRKGKDNILEQLRNQVIVNINSIDKINEIIDLIIKIEEKRDALAYGAPATEKILQEKINLFFELRSLTKC